MRLSALALIAAISVAAAAQQTHHLGKTLIKWRAELDSATRVERLLAARAIGEMAIADRPGSREALFAALEHSDSAVRFWSATAAAYFPEAYSPGARALELALEDAVPEVRIQAALALLLWGQDEPALRILEEGLAHPNRGVRLHAVHAADAIGDKAAGLATALRKAVSDDFDYVQRVARHALWTLNLRPCPYRTCE